MHVAVLFVVILVVGYSSVARGQLLSLESSNAEARVYSQGGTVGSVSLGRQATILKPAGFPSSAAESHQPVLYGTQEGDDLNSLAERFKLPADDICGSNPSLMSSLHLKPGDPIVIPPVHGLVVKVPGDQTAETLASRYQVGLGTLLDYNYLRRPADIRAGQYLVLPGGKGRPCPSQVGTNANRLATGPDLLGPSGCPIHGAYMSQPFGPSRLEGFHSGIDLAAVSGTPILAAAPGTAQVNRGGTGYGNNVMIQVSGQRTDLYGHMSAILVTPGQRVEVGQVVGREGSTGFSTGPHLHWEVRINGASINPAGLLSC
jgi:murein DD-endopeptidase MepM/ murein hydrolase activator NlpD